jgi:meso-butanediol dehydrogenase/(S,S)-butanediol dehydrogenase/diacetyl reductase
VNISSITGLVGSTTQPAQAAAKAGMISLTKSLALDYAPHDIRANAICPGCVWSRPWERLTGRLKRTVPAFADLDAGGIFLEVVKRAVPLGREQTLEDIGQLAAVLASDAARNITGQWIAVDGGITLRQAQ